MWQQEASNDPFRKQNANHFPHDFGNSAVAAMGDNLHQLNVGVCDSFPNTLQPVKMDYNSFTYEPEIGWSQTNQNRDIEQNMFFELMANSGNNQGLFVPNGGHFYGEADIAPRGTKRKGEEDYKTHFPALKQHITDERMAAGMNNLSITNDHNYCSTIDRIFNPDNGLCTNFNSTPVEPDDELTKTEERDCPVFQFTAPLEQFLKTKTDILPPMIVKEICKPCLAVIPWTQPLNSKCEEEMLNKKHDKKVDSNSSTQGIKTETEANFPNRYFVSSVVLENSIKDEDFCEEMEL